MRIYIELLFFVLIVAYLPTVVFYYNCKRIRRSVALSIALWTLPSIFIVAFTLLHFKIGDLSSNMRYIPWFIWVFVTLFFPANIYCLFYGADKLIERFVKKRFIVLRCIGGIIAVITLVGLIFGMCDRKTLSIRRIAIEMDNLPQSFNGLKIAQLSDLHLGNLSQPERYLTEIAEKTNAENPDLLVFTGDLINLYASEGDGLDTQLATIDAPFGKFAVLGNHDYGDYVQWRTADEKADNLHNVKQLYKRLGFDLLIDEHRTLRKDSNEIGIIGVQNCGQPPFPCYGDLGKATDGISTSFNILLSHDPTHWRAEILNHENIQLTLAGHTHGAQLGFDFGKWKWSPSHWIFEEWDGLYQDDEQFLFVNRGLGFVGLPFRLGMRPEITIITLYSKEN